MKYRIAIGPSSFAVADETPLKMLEQAGVEIVPNPYKRRLTEQEIIAHLDSVDGLIAGLEPLNRAVLESASRLKAIARVGIGMDNVDVEAAKELNIRVSNTPDGPTEAVAELCLTALLALGRKLVAFNTDLHGGVWKKRIGIGLRGTRVLLVGYGRIGRRFGDLLHFLGADILVTDPAVAPETLKHGERLISLDEGIQEAEVVSLHANGVETILGEAEFQKMRPGMILLNSARGELIDEEALERALKNGTVADAWLDVFWQEPYSGRLTEFNQILLTPHVSTYTRQCRRSMEEGAVRNLLRDLGIADHSPPASLETRRSQR
jgi:D-3-phosphoglycerate dehydrogenase